MTNEQLGIYLNSLADNIDTLAYDVNSLIFTGEKLKESVWVGEGPKPLLAELQYYLHPDSEDWELQETDDFLAVAKIRDFAADIREKAEILLTASRTQKKQ